MVELRPPLALGYVLLGADHFATGQWDLAIEDYTNALSRWSPSNADGHASGWPARWRTAPGSAPATNRLDEAVRDLRRAFDLERSAPMARSLGAALLQQARLRRGAHGAGAGRGAAGRHLAGALAAGLRLLGAGDAQKALDSFEQAAKLTERARRSWRMCPWAAALAKVELGEWTRPCSG